MFGERARRVVSSFVDGGGVGELEAHCELPSLSSFLRVLHFCERSAAWRASHRCHRADYFWRAEGGAEEVRSSREHRAGAPMQRAAVLFYGLTRSLQWTRASIERHVFAPLSNAGVHFDAAGASDGRGACGRSSAGESSRADAR